MKQEEARQRKQKRALGRRTLREHRRGVYIHISLARDWGDGASIWKYWVCPRCPAHYDDLRYQKELS